MTGRPASESPQEACLSALRTIVVFSGRFQPFHSGHYGAYRALVERFGEPAVYVATSDRRDLPRSPLGFDLKERVITELFGLSPDRVVCVRSPYRPVEVLERFDAPTTAYVAVVSEKDAGRLSRGRYFRPLPEGGPVEAYEHAGYVLEVPTLGDLSGSEIRARLRHGSQAPAETLREIYGEVPEDLERDLIKALGPSAG